MKLTTKQLRQIIKEELQRARLREAMSTQDASETLQKLDNLISSISEMQPEAQEKLLSLKNQLVAQIKAAAGYGDVDPGLEVDPGKKLGQGAMPPAPGRTRGPGKGTPPTQYGGRKSK